MVLQGIERDEKGAKKDKKGYTVIIRRKRVKKRRKKIVKDKSYKRGWKGIERG